MKLIIMRKALIVYGLKSNAANVQFECEHRAALNTVAFFMFGRRVK